MAPSVCYCDICGPRGKNIPSITRNSHMRSQNSQRLYTQAAEINMTRHISTDDDTTEMPLEDLDFQAVVVAVTELQDIQRTINDDMALDTLGPITLEFCKETFELATLPTLCPPLNPTSSDSQKFQNHRTSLQRYIARLEDFDTLDHVTVKASLAQTLIIARECLDKYTKMESEAWETVLARAALQRELEEKFSLIDDTDSSTGPSPKGNIIHLSCLFLVTILCILCDLDDGGASFVLQSLKVIVTTTFMYTNIPTGTQEKILQHFPVTASAGIRLFGLDPDFKFLMICPDCSTRYPTYDPKDPTTHISTCSSCDSEGRVCGAALLCKVSRGNKSYTRPIRRYPLQSVARWICRMMSRPEFEELIDRPFQKDASRGKWDVWNSDYMAAFRGPDNGIFMDTAGHLLFAMAVDWLNPQGNMEAKKKYSIGAIYVICLNLPLATRFLLENICIVGIIPGPKEPRMDQAHHFFQPIVAEFKELWNPGLWIKSTRRFPLGRLMRAAIGPFIGDLPAVKKCLGFTSHSSTNFCHYCKATNDWMDVFDTSHWEALNRTHDDHRNTLARLAAATTAAEREAITASTGVRTAETNQLPYFDPIQHAGIDQLHLWMSIIRQLLRDVWQMSDSLPSAVPSDPIPSWPTVTQENLQEAEGMMLMASKSQLGRLGKPIVQELCYRRGINWQRTIGQMVRDLEAWRYDKSIVDVNGVVRDLIPRDIPVVYPVQQAPTPNKNTPEVQDALLALYFKSAKVEHALLDGLLLPTLVRACKTRDLNTHKKKKNDLVAALLDYHREERERQSQDALLAQYFKNPDVEPAWLDGLLLSTLVRACKACNLDTEQKEKDELLLVLLNHHRQPRQPPIAPEDSESQVPETEIFADEDIPLPSDSFAILGSDVLELVREDIARTTFPSWTKRTPKGIGSISFGKLSSEELKSTLLISLPITLTRLWGPEGGKRALYLENMVHLALAIRLANRRLITEHALDLYERHYRAFVEGFVVLYPWESVHPYQHVGLHLPPVLRLWGPGDNCNANPPELFNGMIQDIKTNNRFPELEVTAARDFAVGSNLKSLFAYNALPEQLAAFKPAIKSFLSKKYQGGLARTVPGNHFDPTREDWVIETKQAQPRIFDRAEYSRLDKELDCRPSLKRAVLYCTGVSIGHIRYQALEISRHNSRVLYRIRDGSLHCGLIQQIFAEPREKDPAHATEAQRIFLIIKRFAPLEEDDAQKDPYGNHPLLGKHGYDICRLYYDRCEVADAVRVQDIISHVSTCPNEDDDVLSQPTIITVALDRDYVGSQNPASCIFPPFVPPRKKAPVDYDAQGFPLPVANPRPHTLIPPPAAVPAPLPHLLQGYDTDNSTPRGSLEPQVDQNTPRASPAPSQLSSVSSSAATQPEYHRDSMSTNQSFQSAYDPASYHPVNSIGGEGSVSGSMHYQIAAPTAGAGPSAPPAGSTSSYGMNVNPDAHAQAYGHSHHIGRQYSAYILTRATQRHKPYPSGSEETVKARKAPRNQKKSSR